MKTTTKAEMYTECQKHGTDTGFLANVILTSHRNPVAKLRGLVTLLKAGHECRTAQFDLDILVIDGKRYGWEVLESPAVIKEWAKYAESVA
jgi:hypothetical protein